MEFLGDLKDLTRVQASELRNLIKSLMNYNVRNSNELSNKKNLAISKMNELISNCESKDNYDFYEKLKRMITESIAELDKIRSGLSNR